MFFLRLTFLLLCPTILQASLWGYGKNFGPSTWAQLEKSYFLCEQGHEQSPVDISSSAVTYSGDFSYKGVSNTTLTMTDNGHTIKFDVDGKNQVFFNGGTYDLLQFHFHAHSEHSIDGQTYPLEMHMVHKNQITKKLLVIGVFFEVSESSTLLSRIFGLIDGQVVPGSITNVNVWELLPENPFFHYHGSLTTPPCSEGVDWIVYQNTQKISASDLTKFTSRYPSNFRPTQALFEREFLSAP